MDVAQTFIGAKEEFCLDEIGLKCVPDSWETLEYCCVTLDCKFNKQLKEYFCQCNDGYKPNEDPNTDDACYYAQNYDYVVWVTVGVLSFFFLCIFLNFLNRLLVRRMALKRASEEQGGAENAAVETDQTASAPEGEMLGQVGFEAFAPPQQPSTAAVHPRDDDKPPSYDSLVLNQTEKT